MLGAPASGLVLPRERRRESGLFPHRGTAFQQLAGFQSGPFGFVLEVKLLIPWNLAALFPSGEFSSKHFLARHACRAG
jgi:hypothetical protein